MPQPACIRHTDLPGTSKLFADLGYHFDRVQKFYRHDPHDPASFSKAASEINYPDERRAALVDALKKQNGESAALQKLAQPGTVVVVTGQQVGLFSGPAYTIYKALTAVKVAERLTLNGTPAVPVFWLATEDHDLDEVDHTWVFGPSGEPQKLQTQRLGNESGKPRPVGPISITPPLAELRAIFAGLPYADDVMNIVTQAYAPEPGSSAVTLGGGFRRLLKTILQKLDILYLDPLDPAIRAIGTPFMVQALSAAPELRSLLTDRNEELTKAGYHAQVHVDAKSSLFFLLENNERKQLRLQDSEYAGLADRAADISPNALLRPVWQDYLLPTVAYVGGPGELAYLAQSQVLYERLLGRMPVAMARSGFTILDSRAQKLLARYGLTVTQIFANEEALKDRVAAALVPRTVEQSLAKATTDVAQRVDRLKAELEKFDPTLAAALEKSRAKIVYQMDKMRKKTAREALRRNERAAADAHYLSSSIYPQGHPQERFYSILPFLAQNGLDFIDQIAETVEYECPDHRVFAASL